jgi:alkaline phosphatase D
MILNNRGYLDANTKADGADKTMIGTEQLEWLKQQLKTSGCKG